MKVSKKPGHTRSLNVFLVNQKLCVIDMPGYGEHMPSNFFLVVEGYLSTRRCLCRTFLLVDGSTGPTPDDMIAFRMLSDYGLPYVVVVTKIDQVATSQLTRNVVSILRSCDVNAGHGCFSQPFLVSSTAGDGIILLQTFITYITGYINVDFSC